MEGVPTTVPTLLVALSVPVTKAISCQKMSVHAKVKTYIAHAYMHCLSLKPSFVSCFFFSRPRYL